MVLSLLYSFGSVSVLLFMLAGIPRGSLLLLICFFKQKTAYELRISDWSSDVCSSDLNDRDRIRGDRPALRKEPEQPCDRNQRAEDGADDDVERQVALAEFDDLAVAAGARRGDRPLNPPRDRPDDLEQRPQRRDADRPRADEADLLRKNRIDDGIDRTNDALGRGQHGHQPAPRDQHPGEHRQPDRQADEMADADQRQRQAGAHPARARTELEILADLGRRQLHRAEQREPRADQCAEDDGAQPALILLDAVTRARDRKSTRLNSSP